MAVAAPAALSSQIQAHLESKSLPPTPQWLSTFLATQRPNLPVAALKQTALFRLLASDISTSLLATPSSVFPPDILDAQIQARMLAGPIPVQVLDIEDVGSSRWSQIEAIEAAERGETTRGREIIRVVPGEVGAGEAAPAAGSGPHKVLLQDAKGIKVFGFELSSVDGINAGMAIGAKIVLRNIKVARGLVLLEPESTSVAGGKIEVLHKAWKDGRKTQLKAAIGASNDT